MTLPLLPLARREFLRRTGLGCGSLALAWLLHREGLLAHGGDEAAALRRPRPRRSSGCS